MALFGALALQKTSPPRRRILLEIGDEEKDASEDDHRTIRPIRMRIMKMKIRMNLKIINDQG